MRNLPSTTHLHRDDGESAVLRTFAYIQMQQGKKCADKFVDPSIASVAQTGGPLLISLAVADDVKLSFAAVAGSGEWKTQTL